MTVLISSGYRGILFILLPPSLYSILSYTKSSTSFPDTRIFVHQDIPQTPHAITQHHRLLSVHITTTDFMIFSLDFYLHYFILCHSHLYNNCTIKTASQPHHHYHQQMLLLLPCLHC